KKAPSFELMFHSRLWKDNFLSRISFSYARFQPRQNPIPVYLVEFTSPYKVYPGTLSFQPLEYFGLTVDNQVRIIKRNGFELMAGLGISIMKATLVYDLKYDQYADMSASRKEWVGGFNGCATALYELNEHFSFFADLQYQYATFTDHSTKFHNRKIGLGILFTINNDG
ncbi:MAG TPA: hypothetical protein VL092_09410, partial [Chitinophagaceae bacterium]|nr:hypothetical protein [Chitinophagaceae bacterium]